MSQVKTRKEIEEKFKWHLEDIFESDEKWESAFSEIKARAEKFSVYFSKILKKEYPDISPKDSNGTNPAWQKDLAEYKKYCKKIENP